MLKRVLFVVGGSIGIGFILWAWVSSRGGAEVQLMRLPYPYRAALAIGTDFHGVGNSEDFRSMYLLLNSREETPYGPGLGLEIAGSFWFYAEDSTRLSYFRGVSDQPSSFAHVIRAYIHAGYIDALHSYGGFRDRGSFDRALAVAALEEMRRHGLNVPIWSNHGGAANSGNLNAGEALHEGAKLSSPAYHADLTAQAGFRFFWVGALTDAIGQGRPLTLVEFVRPDWSRPVRTLRRLVAAYVGRDNVRTRNQLIYPVTLDDGRVVYAFRRFNNSSDLWRGATGNLDRQLDGAVLDSLVSVGGYMIVYNHLLSAFPFRTQDLEALRGLARRYEEGEILVAATARLLRYHLLSASIRWSVEWSDPESLLIRIDRTLLDPVLGELRLSAEDLLGLTFTVPDPEHTRLLLGSEPIKLVANPPDNKGRRSVSVPWRRMTFDTEILGGRPIVGRAAGVAVVEY